MKLEYYIQQYNQIINQAKKENIIYDSMIHSYHHIIPLSIGGLDDKDNIVILTHRQHLEAHNLLFKIYTLKAISVTQALKSMIGMQNWRYYSQYDITNDMYNDFENNRKNAVIIQSKRKIINIESLKEIKINIYDELPHGFMEYPNNIKKRKSIKIINKCNGIIKKWWKDIQLPSANWEFVQKQKCSKNKIITYKEKTKKKLKWIYNSITGKNIRIPYDEKIPDGWVAGRKFTEKQMFKIMQGAYNSQKIFNSNPQLFGKDTFYIYNEQLNIEKRIPNGQSIPDGWKRGRKTTIRK